MRVCPAARKNLQAIATIEAASYPLKLVATLKQFKNFFRTATSKDHLDIVEENKTVLGFACYSLHKPTRHTCTIWDIAITPAKRRKGAAFTLMSRILEKAQKHAIRRVRLKVFKNNLPARALYGKFGFRRFKTVKKEPGNEVVFIMELLTK